MYIIWLQTQRWKLRYIIGYPKTNSRFRILQICVGMTMLNVWIRTWIRIVWFYCNFHCESQVWHCFSYSRSFAFLLSSTCISFFNYCWSAPWHSWEFSFGGQLEKSFVWTYAAPIEWTDISISSEPGLWNIQFLVRKKSVL